MGRFVFIEKVKEAKELISELSGVLFCDECGDKNPKHGFFPLFHSPSVSGVTCNRCYLSDDQYRERFKEEKAEEFLDWQVRYAQELEG